MYFKCAWGGWYDYLGINTNKFIKEKNDWIHFCEKHNISSRNEYNLLCLQYEELPKMPDKFYTNFISVEYELSIDD